MPVSRKINKSTTAALAERGDTEQKIFSELGGALLAAEDLTICEHECNLDGALLACGDGNEASAVSLLLPANLKMDREMIDSLFQFGEDELDEDGQASLSSFKIIPASKVLSEGISQEDLETIVEDARCKLAPQAQSINAKLIKLCLYRPEFEDADDRPASGFFDTTEHEDEASFGRLIVCLPVPFSGGELEVWSGDFSRTDKDKKDEKNNFRLFEWGKKMFGIDKPSSSGRYCEDEDDELEYKVSECAPEARVFTTAFLNGCHHLIKPIKYGMQVMLVYSLNYDLKDDEDESAQIERLMEMHNPFQYKSEDGEEDEEENGESLEELLRPPKKRRTNFSRLFSGLITVPDLKRMCRERNLSVSGNKSDLTYRLQCFIRDEEEAAEEEDVEYEIGFDDDEAKSKGALIFHSLRRAFNEPSFLPEGGLVGFPCFHLYEKDFDMPPLSIDNTLVNRNWKAEDLNLKGSDALLFLSSQMLGLYPQAIRLISGYSFNYSSVGEKNELVGRFVVSGIPSGIDAVYKLTNSFNVPREFGSGSYSVRELSYLNLDLAQVGHITDSKALTTDIKWVFDLPTKDDLDVFLNVEKFNQPKPLMRSLVSTFYSGTNSIHTMYGHCAIVVKFPKWADRKSIPGTSGSTGDVDANDDPLFDPEEFTNTKKGYLSFVEFKELYMLDKQEQ
eukprot:Nk52_evm3s78 gene=Nk52_evmTU3s78